MNKIEKQLLENIFDALDRLFDRKCNAIDVHALIFASEKALGETFAEIQFSDYESKLNKIIRNGKSDEIQREEALEVTNKLRSELNDLLPI